MLKLGIVCNDGFSYDLCILRGNVFSSSKRDTSERVNSIVKIGSNLYVIHQLFEVPNFRAAVIFVKKLSTIPYKMFSISHKVLQVNDILKAFEIDVIENVKFCTYYNINSSLNVVIPLPNTIECE